MQKLTRWMCILSSVILGGCAAIDLESEFAHDARLQALILDQSSDRYASIDPLYLSPELKRSLDEFVGYTRDDRRRVQRLQQFMYDEDQLGIVYSTDKTHTAMQLYEARSGNCLSAMNLFVAMARHLGVEAHFQRVQVQPSWDRRGGLLVLSEHINATGHLNQTVRYVADFTPEIALQQRTSEVLSDTEARALYFNNLGVEALIAADYAQAVDYLKNALFLDGDNSIAWNNIGAAYNRLGSTELAEYSYRTAFERDASSAPAIANLAKFYYAQGDIARAREYERAIERFNASNPYYHFAQGSVAFEDGDLEVAREAFEKALELKREEPDFYFALRKVYLAQGKLVEARSLLREANELLALNAEIYRPSSSRLRLLERESALNNSVESARRIIITR